MTTGTGAATPELTLLDILFKLMSMSLLWVMAIAFVMGVISRVLIYFTVKRHEWFTQEFIKRIRAHLDARKDDAPAASFYVNTRKLLEKTYYEVFKVRSVMKRRRPDLLLDPMDRWFLVKQGSAWLIHEVLRHIRFLKGGAQPKMHEMSKSIFQANPAYNRIFGIIPVGTLTELTNLLPGLFVIAGILGTFLGIKAALPDLAGIDLENPDGTRTAIANFLTNITFKMNASIFGILYSVAFSIVNSWLAPERVFVTTVDLFESGLDTIWNMSDQASSQTAMPEFDENKDPMEALASEYLKDEIDRQNGHLNTQPNRGMHKAS
jgi:hypothetical protein